MVFLNLSKSFFRLVTFFSKKKVHHFEKHSDLTPSAETMNNNEKPSDKDNGNEFCTDQQSNVLADVAHGSDVLFARSSNNSTMVRSNSTFRILLHSFVALAHSNDMIIVLASL